MAENEQPKHAGGRPTLYSDELSATICARIADGQSVREICRDEAMPCMSTVFNWLAGNSEFLERYARAKEAQAEHLAEDILDIADDGSNDWIQRAGKDGETFWVENGEALQRSRLRVDARKWLLSKLLPKKYGDKLALGGDSNAPLVVKIVRFGDAGNHTSE